MIRTLASAIALSLALCTTPLVAEPAPATADQAPVYATLDADFARWMDENHVPGLVWGVVQDGKVVHLRAFGVQTPGGRAVDAETRFRIASMSKAFTAYAILTLRDSGKLRLDDPVWKYVPEVRRWGADITVADLLHHSAGFVTDDPWGDRQQVMPEEDFTRLLANGVPRTAPRGTRYEYSNLGYALLGRIVTNLAGVNFADHIRKTVMMPLGMNATTYEVREVSPDRLAKGYRWEDGAWKEEPTMPHGAFGAMGGVVTTASDYARWIGFLLSAWPAQAGDGAPHATVRAMQYGGGLPQLRTRPGREGANCPLAAIYGAGLIAGQDCHLGQVLFHGGGFPGYGSHMLLLPDTGTGLFVLTNRTYSGPSGPLWDAATALQAAGVITPRKTVAEPWLKLAYINAATLWRDGRINPDVLSPNFLMDRDADHWARLIAQRKAEAGTCNFSDAPISATGSLSGTFTWQCTNGRIEGIVLLAPSYTPRIQSLTFDFVPAPVPLDKSAPKR